jgi:hypothetical protein
VAKRLMAAVVVGFALAMALISCAGEVTTTTTVTATTTKTKHVTATTAASAESVSTATTQPIVVWQTVRYEQSNPGIKYEGAWTRSSDGSASKGTFVWADAEGASLTFHFVGSYCAWLAKTSDQYGRATITVDDATPSTVDLYSKNTMFRHVVWETKDLAFGDHTVTIEWSGTKKKGSSGTSINLDALEITGALVARYQQNDPRLEYAGNWKTVKDQEAAGGSFILSKSSKASVTVHFTGIQIDWFAKQGPAYGKAQVIVDDGDPVTIDLYSGDELWREIVWSSGRLPMGPHTLEIRRTGSKDPAATGTYIDVDEFQISGTVDSGSAETSTT